MVFGAQLFGADLFGQTTAATQGSTLNVPLPERVNEDIYPPAPYLQFIEVEASTGSILRVVDWGDPSQTTMGEVTFDGNQWTSINLALPDYETDLDGRISVAVVAVQDPTRTILTYVKANNNLRDAKVTTRLIRFDKIDTPSESDDRILRVKQVQALEGPARVQFVLGAPNLADLGFPIVSMNRYGCHHVFERRFIHDTRNFCHYPSDEFDIQTEQVIVAPSDLEEPALFGWYSVRGATGFAVAPITAFDLTFADTGASEDGRPIYGLKLESDKDALMWNASQVPNVMFKRIIDSNESTIDFDVQTRMLFKDDTNTQLDQLSGIIIQPESALDDFHIAGFHQLQNGGSGVSYKLESRLTESDVSADSNLDDPTTYNAVRVTKSGTTFKVYGRVEDVSKTVDDANAWTEEHSFTWTTTGNLRVGLVNCFGGTAAAGTTQFEAYFSHFRFLAGGFDRCDRSRAHCEVRENTHQRSGYESMPDDAGNF